MDNDLHGRAYRKSLMTVIEKEPVSSASISSKPGIVAEQKKKQTITIVLMHLKISCYIPANSMR